MKRERLETELFRALAPARLSEERAAAIRAALRTAPVGPRRSRRAWMAVAAAMLALPALALWRATQPPRLEMPPPGPATPFERLAVERHESGLEGSDGAVLRTASAPTARAWSLARTGVDVHLPDVRPAEDDGRFMLQGVRAAEYRGAPAVTVWYAVDGRPVTLTVARAEDVPDRVPAWTLAGKRIRAHAVGGHNLLSWTNSGQSYALVSDLPDGGRRACLVCHTQPGRRRVIERLAP